MGRFNGTLVRVWGLFTNSYLSSIIICQNFLILLVCISYFVCVLCAIYLYDCKINILPLSIRRGMYVALYTLCLREYDEQGHFTIMPQPLTFFYSLHFCVVSESWLGLVICCNFVGLFYFPVYNDFVCINWFGSKWNKLGYWISANQT